VSLRGKSEPVSNRAREEAEMRRLFAAISDEGLGLVVELMRDEYARRLKRLGRELRDARDRR
jgi:hypothetical protein